MNCPVCKMSALYPKDLETNLPALECGLCSGRWVSSWQYWKWKERSGNDLPPADAESADPPVDDSTAAKLCPECGHFLRRYPVGAGLTFSLDRCGNCGGMWFDRNEWEVLKKHGLHDVHKIFSEIWQHQVLSEEQAKARERLYLDKFGPDDYARASEIKGWIDGHPLKSELRAFLKL